MSTVGFLLRAQARRSWVAWVGIGLVLALTAGVAMAGMAGARRTASAYPRFLAAAKAPDMVVEPPFDPSGQVSDPAVLQQIADHFLTSVGQLPQVRSVSVSRGANALLPGPDGLPDVGRLIEGLASINGRYLTTDRVALVGGKLPDPRWADQVLVDESYAERHHVSPGSTMTLWLVTDPNVAPDASPSALAAASHRQTFHVTGVCIMSDEVLQDDIARVDRVIFTPAFARAYPSTLMFTRTALILRHGRADIPAVQQAVQLIGTALLPNGDVPVEVESTAVDRTQRAIRPVAVALGAFSLLLALAIALIVGPLLARAVRLRDQDTLRALGVSAGDQYLVPMLAAAGVGIVAAVLAVGVAIALSPFAPLGVVHDIEPQPGVSADWTVLAAGCALVVALTVIAAALGVRRTRTRTAARRPLAAVASQAAAAGFSPPAVVGLGAALDPGYGARPAPVRAAIAGITLSVTFLIAVVMFGASLDHFSRTPALYGWNWNVMIQSQSGYGYVDLNQYRADLRAIPGVRAASVVSYDKIAVDGQDVSALGFVDLIGRVPLALEQGHMPTADNQVVLGSSTLAMLHRSVGQEVQVSAAGGSVRARIVGQATFPAIGRADAQRTGLGDGIAMTASGMAAISPSSYPNAVLIDVAPGARGRAATAAIDHRYNRGLNQVLTDQRSADIVDYERINVAPVVLAGVLGLVALATLVYSLATSTHSRRRDLALLKSLGFVRWQVIATVLWQASIVICLALVVGIPLGILGGRVIWSAFAGQVGAPAATSVVPWVILTLIAVGVVVVANLAALAPAVAAARTKPAAVLRSE